MEKLENDFLEISFTDLGGQVISIKGKSKNIEFGWNGDTNYWKSFSPPLFPIVGTILDNEYTFEGKTYPLLIHGFASKTNFEITSVDENKIVFEISDTDETLKVYPFKFSFEITHTLNKNSLTTEFKVTNKDERPIYFGLGGHPAYMCPINKDLTFSDYYLEFDKEETADTLLLKGKGILSRNREPFLNNERIINLDYSYFDRLDTLIFEDLKSSTVSLKSKKDPSYLQMDFSEFKSLGIWSMVNKKAPYVCIEPWVTHADFEDSSKDITEKENFVKLEPSKVYSKKYTTSFFE